MIKLIIFLVLSSVIIFWFWKSLRNLQSYGYFRFFAFESVLGLLLLNVDYWFFEPLSALQIISWLLLLSSIILAIDGFYLLHTLGQPKRGIEETAILVKRGAYKYIRHPLYGSLLLLSFGVFLKHPSLFSAGLVLLASAFLIATARAEERYNLKRFGDEYAAYMKETKMFIPFLI